MTEKHTPGPWHSGGMPNRAPVIYTAAGNPIAVLSIGYGRENDQRAAEANAALIAAAPELLAALRQSFDWISRHCRGNPYLTEPGRTIAAAIAKAEGAAND